LDAVAPPPKPPLQVWCQISQKIYEIRRPHSDDFNYFHIILFPKSINLSLYFSLLALSNSQKYSGGTSTFQYESSLINYLKVQVERSREKSFGKSITKEKFVALNHGQL